MGNNSNTNKHFPIEYRPAEVLDRSFNDAINALAFSPAGTSLDAFSRLRTSSPQTIWDSQFEYTLHPLFYAQTTENNGTITHNAPFSSAALNVSTDNASKAQLQTFEYFRYQPGKSQMVLCTCLFADATTGLDQRIGQFDDNNGFFFELSGSTFSVVRRTKTSGSVVNNKTAQANWNLDPMDGTGPSGITLDLTKVQILWIDYQWLGVGRIRYGFDIDGVLYYVHEEHIANTIATPSTTTANLPLRAEAVNTSAIAGARTFQWICTAVSSEGGQEAQTGHSFTGGNQGTLRTGIGATAVPITSIRPAATLNSITNRAKVRLESVDIFADNRMYWQLIYKPTSITGASFSAISAHSAVEVDVAGTAITGGIPIASGYVAANNKGGISGSDISQRYPIALDPAGTDQTASISVVVQTLGATNKSAAAVLNWVEVR